MSLTKEPTTDIIRKQSTFKQTVYKSAIDSPFNIKWPRLQTELSTRLLHNLLRVLEPIGEYRKSKLSKKGSKVEVVAPSLVSEQRMLVGINNVTKHIEQLIQKKKVQDDMEQSPGRTPAIFLCRRDIKPVHMCSHLLTMAALANVKLIPLPLESEVLLSKAMNLHRVSVVFLEVSDSDAEEPLRLAVNEVPEVEAPWLAGAITRSNHNNHYSNTRIKILKTTGTFTKKSKS